MPLSRSQISERECDAAELIVDGRGGDGGKAGGRRARVKHLKDLSVPAFLNLE